MVGFPGSSGGSTGVSRRRKLFWFAHASNSVPSTVKCSSDTRPAAWASTRTSRKNASAMSPLEEAIAILGKGRRIPHGIVQAQADEPAKQQVVLELLDQQPLAPHRVEP